MVGFLAGVGATLAGIIFATRPQPTRIALPAAPAAAAAGQGVVTTYHAPQVAEAPPPLAGSIPPHPQDPAPGPAVQAPPPAPAATKPARTAGPDEQTREDAAAAGMTSRARAGG